MLVIKVKSVDVTKKLQNLVKKKKTNTVVTKAGSVKTYKSNRNSTPDYYPTSINE